MFIQPLFNLFVYDAKMKYKCTKRKTTCNKCKNILKTRKHCHCLVKFRGRTHTFCLISFISLVLPLLLSEGDVKRKWQYLNLKETFSNFYVFFLYFITSPIPAPLSLGFSILSLCCAKPWDRLKLLRLSLVRLHLIIEFISLTFENLLFPSFRVDHSFALCSMLY